MGLTRASLILGSFALACNATHAEVSAPHANQSEPLDYIIERTGDLTGSQPLPLVVVLHGRGDQPEKFKDRLEGYASNARFVYLKAPVDEGKGRGWFTFERGPDGSRRTVEKIRQLADQVAVMVKLLAERFPTRGKPIITGFSQGAMVVYAAVLAYPDLFSLALPVSGALFDSLLPNDMDTRGPRLPPVIAFHGEDDPVIPARASIDAVQLLRAYGAPAELRAFPGIPHWIMGDLKSELLGVIERYATRSP